MPIVLGNTSISGIAAGGLPAGVITRPLIGYPGAVLQTVTVRTRTQVEYSAPISGNGTAITVLNLTLTPQKAGNRIILKWMMGGEASDHNLVYTVTRNGTIMPDASDASNNRWAGIGHQLYDGDYSSTPVLDSTMFIDNSSLSVATTYSICVRSSNATARIYRLNRAFGSAGADGNEAGVSVGVAMEINV
jgi:hypothetical protein